MVTINASKRMKKTLKTLLALMAGTMALAACSDDAIVDNNEPQAPQAESKLVPMTFTAHQENEGDTRATIDGTSILWSQLDEISIFDGSAVNCGNQCFKLSSEAGATSGEFEGEAAEDADTYYAIYPYAATTSSQVTDQDCYDAGIDEYRLSDINHFYPTTWGEEDLIRYMNSYHYTPSQIELVLAYLKEESMKSGPQLSGSNIQDVVMPAVQTIATGEHVDASAMLMMAQSTEGTNDLKFKNVVSYFKFTAPFDCSKVQIFDNAKAGKMAGTVTLAYNGGEPTATVTVNGASSITLTGAITGGETYYIATLPQTFTEGITMSFVKSDGTEYVKRTSSSYTLGRNKVSNMGAPEPSLINPPYVTFSATSSQTLSIMDPWSNAIEGLEYSVGGGAWTALGTSTVTFGGSGNDLRLRGTNGWGTAKNNTGNYGIVSFGNETKVACSGDIRTLVDYRNYENANTANARFCKLFSNCSQLTSAPLLPATQLATYCYYNMFESCTSLATAPALPAEVLADGCYGNMFNGCTSLTTAPALTAESLAEECYNGMFYGCTNLVTAPALPATTLVQYCYGMMFFNCTNLETAPYLPATQLAPNCYVQMFSGCRKLNYVKADFTTTPGSSYTWYWLNGVAATGTFVKSPAATWDVTGASGVPSGWTVQQAPTTTGTAKRTGDIDVNWVQLWENGPKFAEYNVGASSVGEYGGYYTWGATEEMTTSNYNQASQNVDGIQGTSDDTAMQIWGSNWQMPSKTDYDNLLANCTVTNTDNYNNTGTAGLIFTGKDDYASNSVFFPTAGFKNMGAAATPDPSFYWSSDYDSSNNFGYCLFVQVSSSTLVTRNINTWMGSQVRAIIKE